MPVADISQMMGRGWGIWISYPLVAHGSNLIIIWPILKDIRLSCIILQKDVVATSSYFVNHLSVRDVATAIGLCTC